MCFSFYLSYFLIPFLSQVCSVFELSFLRAPAPALPHMPLISVVMNCMGLSGLVNTLFDVDDVNVECIDNYHSK